jgi:L-rhamnose-H+ transport protein
MRYLGMSLGMGVALGYCAAFGTLLPPIAKLFLPSIPCDETIVQIASNLPGRVTLIGVLACLVGIALAALAGLNKEPLPERPPGESGDSRRYLSGFDQDPHVGSG